MHDVQKAHADAAGQAADAPVENQAGAAHLPQNPAGALHRRDLNLDRFWPLFFDQLGWWSGASQPLELNPKSEIEMAGMHPSVGHKRFGKISPDRCGYGFDFSKAFLLQQA